MLDTAIVSFIGKKKKFQNPAVLPSSGKIGPFRRS
jgi:hypothetical protein